jgi:hypothetical protein
MELMSLPKTNVKEKDLAFKASRKVLEAVGILNFPSQSPTVVNIFQRTSIILSSIAQATLDRLVGSSTVAQPKGMPDFDGMEEEE